MRKIIFILILISIYGCGLQRRTYCERKAQKVARILKDCPNIIDTVSTSDTVVIFDTIRYAIDTPIDSSGIDSLLAIYCDAVNTKDSVKENSKSEIVRQYIFKECNKINDGTYHLLDQNKDTVTVVLKGRTISVFQSRKVVTVTKTLTVPCPDNSISLWQDIKTNAFRWVLIFIGGGITFLVVFRRR